MVIHGGYDVLIEAPTRVRGVRLALENGAIFEGRGFGAAVPAGGEVVFNTAMGGYQEALTDPSYTGQILVMTASEIGNYGINLEDQESASIAVAGLVIRDYSRVRSNYRSSGHLHDWMAEAGIPGLEDIDTRAIVRMLRTDGAMRGVLESDPGVRDRELVARARWLASMGGRNLAAKAGPSESGTFTEGLGEWPALISERAEKDEPLVVLALDCGAKRNIYRHLIARGCEVRFIPHDTPAASIRAAFLAGTVHGL
ncbi:MAG: carbamoyl phosphate synthase small subunit, partial [Planctomycetota bacterium]|nr:carbamoyl phosphate synthase small subunit [Planctomycetota bacterium]